MKEVYTKNDVIELFNKLLEHPDLILDLIHNEETIYSIESAIEMVEKES